MSRGKQEASSRPVKVTVLHKRSHMANGGCGRKARKFFFLMATCLYPLSLVPCLVSCRNAGWELSGLVEQRSGLSAWLKTLYTCIFQSV